MHTAVHADSTDHISLVCLKCKKAMRILSVDTMHLPTGEHCTSIDGKCPECGERGYRKMYWEPETLPAHILESAIRDGKVIGLIDD